MLRQFAHKLKEIFVNNKSDHTRELFFDLMVYLYDKFDEFKVIAKSSLIRGFSDPSESIRKNITNYWNCEVRLDSEPHLRTEQLLNVIYDQDEEQTWLTNAVYLLL